MNKIIIEVGSTVTKIDIYDGIEIKKIKDVTILFKKHFLELGKIDEKDIKNLVNNINQSKELSSNIYVCGTSIFRNLKDDEKEEFLAKIKTQTNIDFNIIDQEQENELTVKGATRFTSGKVCVFVGGGGSTEISMYDEKIIEIAHSDIGVIDINKIFKDLANDKPVTSLEEVEEYIKQKITLPTQKCDIMILAGGGHEKFARGSGIRYEENSIYKDDSASIMMTLESRIKETQRYYKEISLDEIRNKSKDPNWWDATRAMCAVVLVIAKEIEAKYIMPTNIAMAYGLVSDK